MRATGRKLRDPDSGDDQSLSRSTNHPLPSNGTESLLETEHDMNRTLLVVALLGVNMFTSNTIAGPRDAQWKEVEDAIKKGLPKTAITNLEPIIQGALKDKAYAEARSEEH